jgi:molecular chaperone DnaK
MSKIIGIDLGTTNSVVAVMEGGEPVVITNPEGGRLTPSVVAFAKTASALVGQVAKRQAVTNPENTVFSIKRFMGRKFDEVSEEMKMVPYRVVRASNGDARVAAMDKEYSPPEISAMILQKLKQAAEEYLGQPVSQAVITVPAYFNDAQRQATKDAGQIAGLEVKRIVNEPTAAALAYGLDKKKDEIIAVYDFGGGTFDISILEVGEGVVEVKATNGDTHLGGDNLDHRIIDWIAGEFKKSEGIDLSKDRMALQRLKEAAEKAKMELSTVMETDINLPFITADQTGPKHLQMKLTRAKFEQLVDDLLQRTIGPTKQALADSGIDRAKIDEVVLVGGSTRIPSVQAIVKESLRQGAAQRESTRKKSFASARRFRPACSPATSRICCCSTSRRCRSGIETMGGVMTTLIPRNTTIPTRKSEILLDRVGQPDERRSPRAARRAALWRATTGRSGKFPPHRSAAGAARCAADRGHLRHRRRTASSTCRRRISVPGKEQKITITSSSGLSKEEVDRMMREAESHAEDDKKRREEIEARQPRRPGGVRRRALHQGFEARTLGRRSAGDSRAASESLKKAIESNDAAAISRGDGRD